MKKILPSSLVAQMVIAVLLALVLAQVISLAILGSAYKTVLFDINQKSQLRQVESLVWLLEESSLNEYGAILAASRSRTAWFTVDENTLIKATKMTAREQRIEQRLLDRLGLYYQGRILVNIRDRLGKRKWRETNSASVEELKGGSCRNPDSCDHPWHHHRRMMDGMRGEYLGSKPSRLTSLKLSVQLQNGLWLNLRAASPVAPPLAAGQTIIFLGLSIVFVLVALAFMLRRITRPLRMLTKASNSLGVGEQVEPLPESGPDDLRETVRAFNQMNDRLQRFVSDRTRMLAALSHDLRTPITSMRLRVELMPDSNDRERLLATLDEMQQMSEATLAFMRQAADNEPTRQVELNAMLGSLCDDLVELGATVQFHEGEEAIIHCRPVSMKRAFRNLIENAVKYGEEADVSFCRDQDRTLTIIIQDKGPGIPEEKIKKVFEPFFRLEGSRNRNTGGIGLGLAIARNIVRNHGGDIELANNTQGLQVKVILPGILG